MSPIHACCAVNAPPRQVDAWAPGQARIAPNPERNGDLQRLAPRARARIGESRRRPPPVSQLQQYRRIAAIFVKWSNFSELLLLRMVISNIQKSQLLLGPPCVRDSLLGVSRWGLR